MTEKVIQDLAITYDQHEGQLLYYKYVEILIKNCN